MWQQAYVFSVVYGNKGFDGTGNFRLWWKRVRDMFTLNRVSQRALNEKNVAKVHDDR
jgi:hypothetical protein